MSALVHGSAQVTDAHLVLLARDHDCAVLSFDRGVLALGEALETPITLLSS